MTAAQNDSVSLILRPHRAVPIPPKDDNEHPVGGIGRTRGAIDAEVGEGDALLLAAPVDGEGGDGNGLRHAGGQAAVGIVAVGAARGDRRARHGRAATKGEVGVRLPARHDERAAATDGKKGGPLALAAHERPAPRVPLRRSGARAGRVRVERLCLRAHHAVVREPKDVLELPVERVRRARYAVDAKVGGRHAPLPAAPIDREGRDGHGAGRTPGRLRGVVEGVHAGGRRSNVGRLLPPDCRQRGRRAGTVGGKRTRHGEGRS